MNSMLHNNLCMICHQKNRHAALETLQRVEHIINQHNISIDDITIHSLTFSWFINAHCQYGLACNTIHSNNMRAEMIARKLEPYLVLISVSENDKLYHEILRFMQGNFPAIYKLMENLHNGCFKNCYKIENQETI